MSCSPTSLILNQTKLVSYYFDNKIEKMDESGKNDLINQREVIQIKVEYAYGIIMEKGDRLIDEDYNQSMLFYKKANKLFLDSKKLSIRILSHRYPNFAKWMKNDLDINFNKEDVVDLYWLAASMAGSIQSSRGSNPHEIINIPIIKKLLETAIDLDPTWGDGALYSAMMSYSAIRPDLNKEAVRDTVDFYFKKALDLSGGTDLSVFVAYAELIHKPRQEKNDFEKKLSHVTNLNVKQNNKHKLNNLIAIKRAKWLLSKKEDYFLE